MSGFELFSHAERFPYRAHIISSASLAIVLCTALTFLPPFLLTYYTGGFWMRESVYSEQPRLNNSIKYALMIDTADTTVKRFFMSSYSSVNRDFVAGVLFGKVSETTRDIDGDGLIDQFRVSFELIFPSTGSPVINSINIWLAFQFEFRRRERIIMETLAPISIVPPSRIVSSDRKNITIYGQLKFEQRQPIRNAGSDSSLNVPIIDADNTLSINSDTILGTYFSRKYYTTYQTDYVSIVPPSPSTAAFTVNAVVNVGRQTVRFIPGFWEEFKWGWIQYIAALLPFMFVFDRLKLFVFSNQMVRTLVPIPTHRHKA
jgi:transmembrane protein 231